MIKIVGGGTFEFVTPSISGDFLHIAFVEYGASGSYTYKLQAGLSSGTLSGNVEWAGNVTNITDDLGTINLTICTDYDKDGYNVSDGTAGLCGPVDCKDNDAAINPGATEVCDGLDNDCDEKIEEDLTRACGSGKCTGTQTCSAGVWGDCSSKDTDCGVCAVCNGLGSCIYDENQDTDCLATSCPADGCGVDGCGTYIYGDYPASVPNECSAIYTCTSNVCTATCETDNDADSYSTSCGDCDNYDNLINPAATEVVGDNIDQNCDTDELCYLDADDDNYRPDAFSTVISDDLDCADAGEASPADPTGDCNDTKATVHPGATELCNGIDDDCDDVIDNFQEACGSGDCAGTQTCSAGSWGDCSSKNYDCGVCAICDSAGTCIYDSTQDGDCTATTCPADGCGVNGCGTNIFGDYPVSVPNECSAIKQCTANSCSATCEADNDVDNYSTSCGDCDDNNDAMFPGNPEVCDNKDNDCDGKVDEDLNRPTQNQNGSCSGNTETCIGGSWKEDAKNYIPIPEESIGSCDGSDNDCDNLTDESKKSCTDTDCNGKVCDGELLAYMIKWRDEHWGCDPNIVFPDCSCASNKNLLDDMVAWKNTHRTCGGG